MFPKRTIWFENGFDAFENGQSVGDCPHPYGTSERTQWLLGYVEAKQIRKQGEALLGAVSDTQPAAN